MMNHPIGKRVFDGLDEHTAMGICSDGESLCLLPGGFLVELG